MNDTTFSENLRKLRLRAKMTQEQLAEAIGYSKKSVSKWEHGGSVPPAQTVRVLASVLHTTMESFFTDSDRFFCLGIDGGGTKTEFVLRDEQENTVASCTLSSSNPIDIGLKSACEVLENGIRTVCSGIPYDSVYLFAGLAGGISGNNREALQSFLDSFGFAGALCGSDNENIIAAGLGTGDGITMVLGTGICAFSVFNGERKRTAGWGYLLDGGGSAYNFGADALRAYYEALDGSGPKTSLSEAIETDTGVSGNILLGKVYDGGKRYIASLAHLVFEQAEKEDAVSQAILERNAHCILSILSAATGVFPNGTDIPVVLAGGLSENDRLLRMLFTRADPHWKISVLPVDPVEGALLCAKNLMNQKGKNNEP